MRDGECAWAEGEGGAQKEIPRSSWCESFRRWVTAAPRLSSPAEYSRIVSLAQRIAGLATRRIDARRLGIPSCLCRFGSSPAASDISRGVLLCAVGTWQSLPLKVPVWPVAPSLALWRKLAAGIEEPEIVRERLWFYSSCRQSQQNYRACNLCVFKRVQLIHRAVPKYCAFARCATLWDVVLPAIIAVRVRRHGRGVW